MTAQLSAYGRMGGNPTHRQSQSGTTWTTASIAIRASTDDEAGPLWLQIVAFGKAGDSLATHHKGDMISVSGRLQVNRWRDAEGNDREQLQIVADTIMSARSVRPGANRSSAADRGEGAQ